MTSRPELIDLDRNLLSGLIALGLFCVMAAVFLTAEGKPVTELAYANPEFPDVSVVTGLGYALLGAPEAAGSQAVYQNTESFLVALILIAVLLDAALDGALMLAKRENGGDKK